MATERGMQVRENAGFHFKTYKSWAAVTACSLLEGFLLWRCEFALNQTRAQARPGTDAG